MLLLGSLDLKRAHEGYQTYSDSLVAYLAHRTLFVYFTTMSLLLVLYQLFRVADALGCLSFPSQTPTIV